MRTRPWRTAWPHRSTSTTTTSSARRREGSQPSHGPLAPSAETPGRRAPAAGASSPAPLRGCPDVHEEIAEPADGARIRDVRIDVGRLVLGSRAPEEQAVIVGDHLVPAPAEARVEPGIAEDAARREIRRPVASMGDVKGVHAPDRAVLVCDDVVG